MFGDVYVINSIGGVVMYVVVVMIYVVVDVVWVLSMLM